MGIYCRMSLLYNNTVVNLHQVSDPEWMERVFLLLRRHYKLVSANSIESYFYDNKPLNNSCHITFDDGDESFYRVVFPIVKRLQIPVSIYVSPKAIVKNESFWFQKFKATNKEALRKEILLKERFAPIINAVKDLPAIVLCKCLEISELNQIIDHNLSSNENEVVVAKNMNIDELIEVSNSGFVEVGAHTMNHPILSNESDKNAEWEIASSISELSELLHKPVRHFAFPNGRYDLDFGDREIELVTKYGIRLSFSTEHTSFSKNNNPLTVPRKGLSHGSNTLILAKLILSKKWDYLKHAIHSNDETEMRIMLKQLLEPMSNM